MLSGFRSKNRDTTYGPDFLPGSFEGKSDFAERPTVSFSAVRPSRGDANRNCPEGNRIAGEGIVNDSQASARGLIWVDGVGGMLVCLADSVTIGQSVPESGLEIPILGDLSRRHARIHRRAGDYILEPLASVHVERRLVQGFTPLEDGHEIQIGNGVRLRFRKPHPLSNTARLDFESHHRTQPSADGVILFGETCLLGPNPRNHIICRYWKQEVVLSRAKAGELRFRCGERVKIDGHPAADTGQIGWNSRIEGRDFAFRMERL